MSKIEIFDGNWTFDLVKKSTNKIFVFGDNNLRTGRGGQAIIRDLPNSIGLRTKKGPSNNSIAFYNDGEYESNCQKIIEDLILIKSKITEGHTIVFSNNGYGTGLANLKSKSPKTFEFLCDSLKDFFEFDNERGNFFKKFPSINEIESGEYIQFSNINNNLLLPVNNSFFNEKLLGLGINDYFQAIKFEKKVAFTSKQVYKKNQILIFSFPNQEDYLVVKVLHDSYDYKQLGLDTWSKLEGLSTNFIKGDKKWKQTIFSYVCQMNDKGKIEFKPDLFKETKELDNKTNGKIVDETIVEKIEEVKDDNLNSVKKLLEKEGLIGEITKMPFDKSKKIKYQVKVGDTFYAIEYNKFFFWDSINILLTSKNPFI